MSQINPSPAAIIITVIALLVLGVLILFVWRRIADYENPYQYKPEPGQKPQTPAETAQAPPTEQPLTRREVHGRRRKRRR